VSDFAVLSLCGVDTPTAINFDKGACLGADGSLLSVEAALPWLGRDGHKNVRDRLAAAVGAGGAAEGRVEDVSGSDSDNDWQPEHHWQRQQLAQAQQQAQEQAQRQTQQQAQQQQPAAPPAWHRTRGGCMCVQAAQHAAMCMYCGVRGRPLHRPMLECRCYCYYYCRHAHH
jgi:hypothetical protein